MTYREVLANYNAAYARLVKSETYRPIDEQILVADLITALKAAEPDPPPVAPPIKPPPLPPCLAGEPERIAA